MMAEDPEPVLTERQLQVLARIELRLTIKEIAGDLAISENRVNQHIETLKRRLQAHSLRELAAWHRDQRASAPLPPSRNPSGGKSQLPGRGEDRSNHSRVADGRLVLASAQTFPVDAPWSKASEPPVPPMLDGNHAILLRLATVAALVFGILASLVLIITAAHGLSEALGGRTDPPTTD